MGGDQMWDITPVQAVAPKVFGLLGACLVIVVVAAVGWLVIDIFVRKK